ncbi:MAG: septum formation initiator family protein [Rhodothermales bacterium]|nr:septum formation initiator family protein [Rhodothermales bacterium]
MEIGLLTWLKEPRVRKRFVLAAISFVIVWLTFFDSHSLVKRIAWHRELGQLQQANEELELEISHLETEIEKGLSDERVEQIAREEYHMKKPEETVYRIETAD